ATSEYYLLPLPHVGLTGALLHQQALAKREVTSPRTFLNASMYGVAAITPTVCCVLNSHQHENH
ncbi:MAG: hypothetical protein WBO98_01340, partial [Candidatus Nitrotoga sp.]